MRGDLLEFHVGVDDADSPHGMCTTFLGAILARRIAELGCEFLDYPYLVRLNPNIPFKTRGNGAISLHFRASKGSTSVIVGILEELLAEYGEEHGKTDPTAILVVGGISNLKVLYERGLHELVAPSLVTRALAQIDACVIGGEKGKGIVGAAASIGAYPLTRYSYELLLYRPLRVRSRDRRVDRLVLDIDLMLRPYIFANVDYAAHRIIAIPHGPDPVILGLRSINPLLLSSLMPRLYSSTRAIAAVIYKTNQATGSHLTVRKRVGELRPYDSVVVRGRVAEKPRSIRGGHVVFRLEDSTGFVDCAVYRETGRLAKVARLLVRGDLLEVGGGVKPRNPPHSLTLNVEFLRVLRPIPLLHRLNPLCPNCGRRMKSAGRGRGFKCSYCGYRSREAKKDVRILPRMVEPGLYLQSPSAYRHLSPPLEALGLSSLPANPDPRLFLYPLPLDKLKNRVE